MPFSLLLWKTQWAEIPASTIIKNMLAANVIKKGDPGKHSAMIKYRKFNVNANNLAYNHIPILTMMAMLSVLSFTP